MEIFVLVVSVCYLQLLACEYLHWLNGGGRGRLLLRHGILSLDQRTDVRIGHGASIALLSYGLIQQSC